MGKLDQFFFFNCLNEYLHSFRVICVDIAVFSAAQDLDSDFPFWTQINPPEAGKRRLFPNCGFRHSELGSKIFNAPKAHKHKEQTIIKVFYRVYNKLGYGFLEKIYENATMIEFRIEVGLLLNFVPKPEFKRKGI